MKDEELAAIEARVAAATPEPWEERGGHVGSWHRYKSGVRDMIHFVALASVSIPKRNRQLRPAHEGIGEMSANSAFIAHARQDVPALVAEVRRLRAELEAARSVKPMTGEGTLFVLCPLCGARIEDPWGFDLESGRWETVFCSSCERLFEMRCEVIRQYEARRIETGERS